MYFVYSIDLSTSDILIHDFARSDSSLVELVTNAATAFISSEEGAKKAEYPFKDDTPNEKLTDVVGYFLRRSTKNPLEIEVWKREITTTSGWLGQTHTVSCNKKKLYKITESELSLPVDVVGFRPSKPVMKSGQSASLNDKLITELKQKLLERRGRGSRAPTAVGLTEDEKTPIIEVDSKLDNCGPSIFTGPLTVKPLPETPTPRGSPQVSHPECVGIPVITVTMPSPVIENAVTVIENVKEGMAEFINSPDDATCYDDLPELIETMPELEPIPLQQITQPTNIHPPVFIQKPLFKKPKINTKKYYRKQLTSRYGGQRNKSGNKSD
jgi:hypothetical protein